MMPGRGVWFVVFGLWFGVWGLGFGVCLRFVCGAGGNLGLQKSSSAEGAEETRRTRGKVENATHPLNLPPFSIL